MVKHLLVLLFILISFPKFSYAEDKLGSFFSDEKAFEYIQEIKGDLNHFANLSQEIRDNKKFKLLISDNLDNIGNIQDKENFTIILSGKKIKDLGNIGWGYQNIGFTNKTLFMARFIRYKNYQIKKLELELAIKNESSPAEITKLQNEFDKLSKTMASYLDESMWSD